MAYTPPTPTYQEYSGSAAALNADLLAATDVSSFKSFSYTLSAVATGAVITAQGSNDTTNWTTVQLVSTSSVLGLNNNGQTAGQTFFAPISFRYLRIRQTAWTSGTSTGIIELYSTPPPIIAGNVGASQSGTWSVTAAQSTAGNLQSAVSGNVGAAVADTGNPVKVGFVAKTTNPTAVTDGQRQNSLSDKLGKQVVVQSLRELKGRQATTITSSTTETTIVTAGAAGVFRDVYGLIIANTSATPVTVTIRDVTAGGTATPIQIPANDTRGFMLSESAAIPQTTAASAWTATCGTSVASIQITALYVQNL